MEWLTGLALLPVLMCGLMMGGMALATALGLRGRDGGDATTDEGHPKIPDEEPVRR